MDEVHRTGKEKLGIVGKSVFMSIPNLDIVSRFPTDYMHAVLLGVMKQLWSLWVDSENHKENFSVGLRLTEIEERFLSFRPPSSFPRFPKPLTEYKQFKANEWEGILLHYIFPMMYGILPREYLNHVMLLSFTIFQLLQPDLRDINLCGRRLEHFGKQFQVLYGHQNMTYNVHLSAQQLIKAVHNFGTLYNFSLFPFEAGNGMLLGFRSGSNKPVVQLEQKFILYKLCMFTKVPKRLPIEKWIKELWANKTSGAENKQQYSLLAILCEYDDDVNTRIRTTSKTSS
ncbi:uncharacterized protein LOC129716809 [Wyeomyia smithii]|uniref:uncharacterized protein LOC129716809 n=1 Tax=Wyeomyia smithii TaxID=174621 RepID=UPI0024680E61|nr:uncharacterized protein LOC129716809 [Wyeomyia smithii]